MKTENLIEQAMFTMEFCEQLNTRNKTPDGWKFTLPTETQWEYAARGGKKSKGYKYSGSNIVDEVAWCEEDKSSSGSHPVGQKKANELGLYDMSGNVCEWCLDDWQDKSDKLIAEFWRGNDRSGDNKRACRGGRGVGHGGVALQLGTMVILKILSLILVSKRL